MGIALIITNITVSTNNANLDISLQTLGLLAQADEEVGSGWNPTIYHGETCCDCNGSGCWECSCMIYQYCWFPGTQECTQGTHTVTWEDCDNCNC